MRIPYLAVVWVASLFIHAPVLAAGNFVPVSEKSLEALIIGMTKDQVRALEKNTVEFSEEVTEGCLEANITGRKIDLLFEENILQRISTDNPIFRTAKNVGVGSTEAEVKAAYGRALTIVPHTYDEDGHYLKVIDKTGFGFMFETNGVQVTSMHVGKSPALEYVEGCL